MAPSELGPDLDRRAAAGPLRMTGARRRAIPRSRAPTGRSGPSSLPFGGWLMPLAYPTGTLAEHMACRTDAVAFDVSHLGTVRVQGTGSTDLLQRELSNDLRKVAPGRAQYTHLLDDADGSVARRHHRVVVGRRGVRRHAQRLEHVPGA